MNAETLLAQFDRLSDAPDAIPCLRRFILDLAVRGKLVDQDSQDETASELFKRIQMEKARLIKVGRAKQQEAELLIAEDDEPFRIPPRWLWVRLGEVADLVRGISFPASAKAQVGGPGQLPCFRSGNIQKEVVWDNFIYVPKTVLKSETQLVCRNDILISIANSYELVGKSSIVNDIREEATFGAFLAAIRLHLLVPRYIQHFLSSNYSATAFRKGSAQTTNIANITFGTIRGHKVALPPLAEQHRIVAKVDELMGLCDRLEAAQAERECRRTRLTAASLSRLNEPVDEPAFQGHVQFHLRHFPRFTTHADQVKHLRQTILNLAVRGKLVPQDPTDEPAAAALMVADRVRIATAEFDRRADATSQALLAAEYRWPVPDWEWRGLADLALFVDYRGQTPKKSENGIRLITAKNVKKGFLNLQPEEFISESNYKSWMTRGLPQVGDVLFTTEAPMGNAAVVRLTEPFALAQRVICFRLYGAVDPSFFVLQLLSEPFQLILDKTATGMTAKGIKAAKLKRLPVAIPPLAEQRRIVAKVDELLAVCDQLESQLAAAHTTSRQLLEAVLQEALSPAA